MGNDRMGISKDVPAGWREPLADWLVSMVAADRSPATIKTRVDHLRRAARALGSDPWAVTSDQLVAWVGGQDWSRETRRSVYASLRGFWRWGVAAGRVPAVPTGQLPAVKPSPAIPRPAPASVYREALAAADDRERLILRLAAEAGLRRAEIAQVHAGDLMDDLDGMSLLVHGKGRRDRIVPLTYAVAQGLLVRVAETRGWAFPGDDQGHLSPRYVGILASRLLPDGWTLHTLRHRFASVAYAAERDLISVQTLLGHASVATTQRYVRVPDGALRRAVGHAGAA